MKIPFSYPLLVSCRWAGAKENPCLGFSLALFTWFYAAWSVCHLVQPLLTYKPQKRTLNAATLDRCLPCYTGDRTFPFQAAYFLTLVGSILQGVIRTLSRKTRFVCVPERDERKEKRAYCRPSGSVNNVGKGRHGAVVLSCQAKSSKRRSRLKTSDDNVSCNYYLKIWVEGRQWLLADGWSGSSIAGPQPFFS